MPARKNPADTAQSQHALPGFTRKKKNVSPKFIEAGKRNLKKHEFKPGQSGNPHGTVVFNPQKRFYQAILKYEKKYGRDILDLFIQRAYKDPSLLAVALSKLVPSKQQISVGPEDISILLDAVADIMGKYITEPAKLQAAIDELKALEEKEKQANG